MSSIEKSLEGPRNVLSTVSTDSFTEYIDQYREYRGYVDNTTTLLGKMNINMPKKDEYSKDECIIINIYIYIVVGRIKNLVFNPLSESLDTMDNMTDLLDRVMNLITDLPRNLKNVSDFNYDNFDNVINGYEDWILDIIN